MTELLDSFQATPVVVVVAEGRLSLVHDHPGRAAEVGEAEDPLALGEVRAERVGCRDRCGGGNQLQHAGGDPVVPGDMGALCLEGLSAWDEPPDRDRPEPVVAYDPCQDDARAHRSPPAA